MRGDAPEQAGSLDASRPRTAQFATQFANRHPDRRGRRRPRLSDLSIGAKLALLVVPPVIAILILAAVAAVALGAVPGAGDQRADLSALTATAAAGADVAEALYQERLVVAL